MRRKLLTILAAIIALGPVLSLLYVVSIRWGQPVLECLHTTWAILSIICAFVALVMASDRVLQRGSWLWRSIGLCVGMTAGCAAGLLSLWMMWLTPLRSWLLIVNGPTIAGLFCLLCSCRRRFELRLLGLVFAIGGLALYGVALREIYTIADMTSWTTTEGRITRYRESFSRANKFRMMELAYEYVVDGQRYVGGEDSWESSRMRRGWDEDLDRVWPSYGWDEKIVVYYDPARPQRAVLRPGLSYATAFVLEVSLLSVLGGIVLLVASAQLRRTLCSASLMDKAPSAVDGMSRGSSIPHWPAPMAFAILGVCALLVTTWIQPISANAMRVPRIGRGPTTAKDFSKRGFDFLRKRDPKNASSNFTHALRLDPNNAALYWDRACACAQLGQIPQTLGDWRTAIQLDWSMAFHVYYAHRRLAPDDVELDRIITRVALDHLDDLEEVSGYAVGAMAETGEFYTASLILSAHLKDEDFLRMADNQNPVLCAMALICLARRDIARYEPTIRSFYDEGIEVMYMPMGCGASLISLGALAKSIIEDPKTLGYWDPEKTRWLWQRK
jgi:hypothetical protein